jgi:hypothetical protein
MVLIISHLTLCHLQNVLIIWHFKICITSLLFNTIVWNSQIILHTWEICLLPLAMLN